MGVDKTKEKIYVAGHRGMVGSAIVRSLTSVIASEALQSMPPCALVSRTHAELDLTNQAAVQAFFDKEKPTQAVHAQCVDHIYQYAHEH